uniref:Thioredoxin domain-containing protein n=1 Tax=Ditylenchus dipsaci TaxID=166011 RepID=A0A915DFQ4_9BILA
MRFIFIFWAILPFLGLISVVNAGSKIPTAVLELNEKFLEVMNQGFWFVKFYAPWCGHCKRLAPTWEHLGHALADKNPNIHVAKVDCTRFPSVGNQLKVHGYPTIIFFRNGVQIPFEGERKKEVMMQFAEKSAGPVINNFESSKSFYELKKSSHKEPFFVYLNKDEKEKASEEYLLNEYKAVSEELFTEVRFYRSSSSFVPIASEQGHSDTYPTLIAVKDGNIHVFDPSQGQSVGDWIKSERWPLLPRVSSANIYNIAKSSNKKLVLLLIEPEELIGAINKSSESGKLYQTFRKAAVLSFQDPYLKANFQFGVLEDNSLANNVVMGQLSVPNLIVLNLTSYEFYLSQDQAEQMTEQSVKIFLENVANGNVSVQGGRAWSTRLKRMVYDIVTNIYDMFYHQPVLTVCLFGVPLAFFSIIAYSVCSADFSVDRDEIYPADEEDEDELENEDIDEEQGLEGGDATASEPEDNYDNDRKPLLQKDSNHQKAE